MNSTLSVSRRDFLRVASLAGGGMLVSIYLPARHELFLEPPITETFSPNVWLKIKSTGAVTVTVAKSEMGQGVLTALPMIVAEELDADWSKVKTEQADAHPTKYGSQTTGGSYSVRGSWKTLRTAGATARAMLVAAAAEKWHVDQAACRTKDGVVVGPNGKKISYGELAEVAATLPVPADVPLKDPKDFRLLGQRMKKFDTPSKVYGTATFGIDVRVPGMLFASIEKCPAFGGKVKSFDAAKAKSVAGVKEIVPLDEGVAVVATNTWSAFRGREELKIEWDEGPNANQSSDNIWKTFTAAVQEQGVTVDSKGDVESALASAAAIYESYYRAPFVAHATMEPMNCTADVRSDGCEIWAPTQAPQGAQSEAAKILGLPVEKVIVHVTLLGGGFGRRLNADFVADAVRVSKAVGKPVQVIWKREDDMQHDWYRPATYNLLRAAVDKDGYPVAWLHRIAGPNSRGVVVGGSTPPYAIPNYAVESQLKEIGVPIGAWRSVGPSQNGWVVESFIDELAHAAKKDPLDYRLELLEHSPRLHRALKTVAEKAGWGKPVPAGIGRGIACVESFGSAAAQVAEVSVDDKGNVRVHRIVAAVDCGPVVNPDTIEAQIESAVVYALGAALKDEITIDKGRVQQSSFDDYRMLEYREMPNVEVHIIPSMEPVGGIGEPSLPPCAPAVCNAVFALTGKRIRRLPIERVFLRAK